MNHKPELCACEPLRDFIMNENELGPGLLESVYEVVLSRQLSLRGLTVGRHVPVPIVFKDLRFEEGFCADLIVNGKGVLELKSVERVTPAHKKQVQIYLKLTGLKLGYPLSFGEALLKDGITRCVNGLDDSRSEAAPRRNQPASLPLCASAPPRLCGRNPYDSKSILGFRNRFASLAKSIGTTASTRRRKSR